MSDQEERGGNASPQPSLPSGFEELARERKIWASLPTLLPWPEMDEWIHAWVDRKKE